MHSSFSDSFVCHSFASSFFIPSFSHPSVCSFILSFVYVVSPSSRSSASLSVARSFRRSVGRSLGQSFVSQSTIRQKNFPDMFLLFLETIKQRVTSCTQQFAEQNLVLYNPQSLLCLDSYAPYIFQTWPSSLIQFLIYVFLYITDIFTIHVQRSSSK